ncbi:MAG TPA: response regulator [Desulfuromonadales bacterium]|nr:response regulator [Desulfuromonadales bacterium]
MRLLAIDDNHDNLLTLAALLSAFLPEASLTTALSGREGIQMVRTNQPDMILLDILMPEMDGYEVARILKGDVDTQHIPIIMLTALHSNDSSSKVKGLESGADAFLAKPIDEAELVAQVKTMMRIKRTEDTLRSERDSLEYQIAYRIQQLQEKQLMNQLLLDALPHHAYLINSDRVILATNRIAADDGARIGEYCWCGIHKMSAITEVQKLHFTDTGEPLPDTRCHFCHLDEAMEQQKTVTADVKRDGRIFHVWWIPVDRKVHLHYVMDVTERYQAEDERRRLEQQFHHAQKLESLGVLAGGIAHDFNNILTFILGQCYMARETASTDHDYKASFQQVETAANRAADLCQQMLTYAGKSPLVQTRINLISLVGELVKMLKSAIGKNVVIELSCDDDVPEVLGDTGKIQQIIMNLIINAAEAIGDAQGTIRVVLTRKLFTQGSPEKDTFGTIVNGGCHACLEVTDDGCGMDQETQKRVFEPFYTTKFTGRGLGMSAIQGIVKAHEGLLYLTSAAGVGTTFKVSFPQAQSDVEQVPASDEPTVSENSGGTVLLVDDEEMLLDMGADLLETFGFNAITARNGREAIQICTDRLSSIDVVLLDMIMPVMGGIEAYHELRRISTNLPIIICSGYGVETVEDIIKNDPYAGFVHKPYKPAELRNVMLRMKRSVL